ncbi:hypothetical protein NC651_030745 [Populus alba x Populus x berolinensis]|nr:hypothetical protein NC651_030745 [Populus alba x Populus x berolinensis]
MAFCNKFGSLVRQSIYQNGQVPMGPMLNSIRCMPSTNLFIRGFASGPFLLNNSNPSVTFSTTASPPPPKPLHNNKNQPSLLSKPQNFISPLKQSPSLIPLNDLVNHYKRSSHSHLKTVPIFPKVSNLGSFDDLIEHLVSSYKHSCCPKDANLFHLNVLKHGFDSDLFLCNTVINVYVRTGDWVSARKLFDEMPDRNGVTWACLISGYTQNGMPEDACGVLKEMIFEGFLPNRFAFGSAIRACQESMLCGLQLGMQIHGLIMKSPYANDASLCNVLISMYGKYLGYIDYARSVFDEIEIRNSISWNSIVSVYSQRGDAASCFELFSSMQMADSGLSLKPNEYTFGSLITAACSSIDSGLSLLEQILARIKKSGLVANLYVGSALVGGFSRLGSFDYARKIFEQMTARNAVSMNGLMVGLVRQKCGEEAVEVFKETRHLVDSNLDSYVILLSACAEFALLDEGRRKGREVHGYAIRTGLNDAKVAVGNGLINMYAKCGDIDHARSVFGLMVDKDSVSWNSMITGLDQNKCFEDAVKSYNSMRKTGLMPSNFALISALSSCASLGCILLGQQTHGEGIKLGLDLDVSVSNTLLALYAETGRLAECQKVFSWMLERDQVSWNTVIGALADSGASVSEAVEVFLEMMRAGWSPNRVTFINLLATVSSLSTSKLSHQIHALILKYNVKDDNAIENALLACYGKSGEMENCEEIFSRMSERRDEVSWNSMISGYIHNELLCKAMDLVWLMMQRGQRLDCFTFATVLSACATVATLERGMEVHACAIRACLESDVVIGSALVDMYSKCGRIDYASRFFNLMPVRNLYSWNSMISGYARHGHGDNALRLFTRMKLSDQLPDHITFVGVLSACSHIGLVDEGFEYFKSMTEVYGLVPRVEHYSCMVDLLGRAGELDKIENFINKMPIKPNILIWRTVLGACCRGNGRKTELGRRAAEMLFNMDPQNAVNYVLLSNMYASGGKWEDMARTRRAMREAAVKKEAGCSWVTMKDGVHVFVAGDNSHPEKGLIYAKLKELDKKIRDAGYVPQIKFALYDLEPENKEELLSYHSEKLAVAFVLTRNSGLPIRIMKNLRVCGDCHSAFKYISKVVDRSIVLRDSNRFIVMESKGSEIDEFEKALESALDGSTEEDENEGEYSDDDEEEEDDDDDEDEEEENALDSMEQNQQFEYEALAEKKRKTLADAKGEGSAKKARQEDMTGASLAEIEEIMNFGMRKKRRRRMPKRRGRRKGSKNKLSPEITRMLGDATLHYAHGNYEEALTVLSEVVKRAPLVADSYHTLGLVHKALGNTEKAMKFYRIAAFLRPKDSSLWKLLFSWHVLLGILNGCLSFSFQTVLAATREQGDIARAWKCLSKAISADPDDISLRSLHALFYDELGDHQRAAESYEQIVRICPEDVEAIKTAAKMYLNCGQIKRCVGILEDYLKGHPSEADLSVIILLADVFMEIDAHNNALQHIERAQMIYYSGKELPLELMIKAGICHVFLGNIEKAEIHFSALQQENFSIHPEFITKVADAFMSTECFHSALKYYHMLELNVGADNEGEIHVKIAQCYLSLNDRAKAIMFFYKALPMLKDSIDARVALASLILEDAKEDEAISLLSPPKDLDSLNSNSYMQNPWWLDGKIKLKLCHIYKAKGMLEDFVNTISPLVCESLYVKTLRPKVKKRLTMSVLRERISILNVQENDDVFGEVRPLASKSDLARKLLQKKEEQKAADKAAGIDLPSDYSDDESLLCKALQSLQRYSEALEIINLTLRLVSDKLPGDREEQLQSLLAQISFNATDPKHGFDYVRSAIQKQPHSIAAWNCYYKITSRMLENLWNLV